MADTKLVKELEEEGITVEEDLLSEVVHLVTELHIDNEDLVNEWQAYCISSKNKQVDEAKIVRSSFNVFAKKLRLSKSVKIAKKSKPRSGQFGVHSAASMQPLMENLSTPNKPARPNLRTPCNPRTMNSNSNSNSAAPKQDSNDSEDLFNELMSMETPSKSGSTKSALNQSMMQSPAPCSSNSAHSNSEQHQSVHSPAPSGEQYKSRKSGDVMDVYNAHLPKKGSLDAARLRLSVIVPEEHGAQYPFKVQSLDATENDERAKAKDVDEKAYRFMYEDVHAAQKAIAERMTFLGEQLSVAITAEQETKTETVDDDKMDTDADTAKGKATESESESEYSALDVPSQRECLFLGRIINDGDNAGSDKITAGNMLLESPSGIRVKLDICAIAQCALFPGQTVAVRGINSSGKEIVASALYTAAGICSKRVTHRQTTHRLQINADSNNAQEVVQMMVAAGPFTAKTSVEFKGSPLHELAKVALIRRPSVVVLCGPFTDGDNDQVKNGEVHCTLHALFAHLLTGFMHLLADNEFEGKVIVVPSTKDVHHFSAFPQRAYVLNEGGAAAALTEAVSDGRLSLVGNPCELRINNVSVGVCAENFLFDCARLGLQRGISDRLCGIMACCLDQQSFYPQQPANPKMRMDMSGHRKLYMHDKCDVFVMPSNLKQFAKCYGGTGTVCVNTGFLTRGNTSGSYALISVLQSNDYNVEDYAQLTRVDILRI